VLAAAALATVPPVATLAAPPSTDPAVEDGGQVEVGPSDDGGDPGTVSGGETDTTPVTLPVVPVPVGCEAPTLPHIVFVGEVRDRDFRTVRFRIESIRAGRPDPFASGDRIDVRYGLDAQYLEDGATYLVGAVVDPDLGILVSRVTEPIEDFGGDEVIGVSETDVDCPAFEDPMRTLHVDGTPVDASVVGPFLDAKVRIAAAILVPFSLAVGAIFVLAMLRLSVTGLYQSVVGGRHRAA
jgi:hypothetical protein